MLVVGMASVAADSPDLNAILASSRSRANYLAHARIWSEPDSVTPEDVLDGPAGMFPFAPRSGEDLTDCTFATRGRELGGQSPKFLCTTSDGRPLRVKYWDPEVGKGNREVFAAVAGTRLLWAAGFNALPAFSLNVRCHGCPANPFDGKGPLSTRDYMAAWQAYPPGPWILSREDRDEGWSWRELDEAIAALPAGPERVRQRTHFDALTLLGVFMQHGDRKPAQQALYCAGSVAASGGKTKPWTHDATHVLLIDRPDPPSCARPAVMIVDVGATFGGAGRTSNELSAKMDLAAWRHHQVFATARDDRACRGRLTVSFAAGHNGEPDPIISEEGRRFLLEQLQRLTPAHVRALFTAARVDQLGDSVTDWVDAFEDKVNQIAAARCLPAS
jgi:hypothetical protein